MPVLCLTWVPPTHLPLRAPQQLTASAFFSTYLSMPAQLIESEIGRHLQLMIFSPESIVRAATAYPAAMRRVPFMSAPHLPWAHSAQGKHIMGQDRRGTACWRLSLRLATISSLSSFLSPTWLRYRDCYRPIAGALSGHKGEVMR